MALEKWTVTNLEQLALGLVIDEPADTAASERIPTPEEARLISETAREAFEDQGQGKLPAWVEEYQQLRQAGWPWRVAAYIAWAASPRQGRTPANQQDLATKYLGLTSDRAIATWRRKNPAIDETIAMLQAAPLFAHRRDIYEALISSASSNDSRGHQDRKLALELIGDYTPRVKVDTQRGSIEPEDLSQLSDQELDQIAAAIKARRPEETDGEG